MLPGNSEQHLWLDRGFANFPVKAGAVLTVLDLYRRRTSEPDESRQIPTLGSRL